MPIIKQKKYYYFGLFLILFIVSILINYYLYRSRSSENDKYPNIEESSQSYYGIVYKYEKSQFRNGGFLIELSNAQKFTIDSYTYNKAYTPDQIVSFLQKNDSLYRPTGTDSIYIFRNNIKYYFVSGKVIN